MKKIQISLLSLAVLAMVSCKNETKKVEEEVTETVEEVVENVEKEMNKINSLAFALESKSGSNASGKVGIIMEGDVLKFEAIINNLEPGTHAIHIHEKADCSSADGKSSGGHWNPTREDHGKWGDAKGYHKGDIGNFEVGEDGIGRVEFSTDEWCLGCGDPNKDILGKAIIVHQGADDFISQPSGAAGARVSCGGIIQ